MKYVKEVMLKLMRVAPESIVEIAKRASESNMKFIGPLLRRGVRWLVGSGGVIQRGPGAGLKFTLGSTGFPGQILGTTDIHEQNALADCLSEGDTFYDVGANAGFYSIIGGKIVGGNGKVYAFEPHTEYAKLIEKNVSGNEMSDIVEIYRIAVSDVDEKVKMNTDKQNPQTFEVVKNEKERGSMVEARKLDTIIEEKSIAPPDVVKIDVEGHEVEVMRGMLDIIKEKKPDIILEVHGNAEEIENMIKNDIKEVGYKWNIISTRNEGNVFRSHILLR